MAGQPHPELGGEGALGAELTGVGATGGCLGSPVPDWGVGGGRIWSGAIGKGLQEVGQPCPLFMRGAIRGGADGGRDRRSLASQPHPRSGCFTGPSGHPQPLVVLVVTVLQLLAFYIYIKPGFLTLNYFQIKGKGKYRGANN